MAHIDLQKYFVEEKEHETGRPRYDREKSAIQRLYEKVYDCYKKLKSYAQKIEICGEDRNSYSKTDHDATFMRFKKDHMVPCCG